MMGIKIMGQSSPMKLADLRDQLRESGAKPCHEARLLRKWLSSTPWDIPGGLADAGMNYPHALSLVLPNLAQQLQSVAKIRNEFPGNDASVRLLIELSDGQLVESVLLPKDGLCVSSQVGCAVGCIFCTTGQGGLTRQLTSLEIVAQLVLAKRYRPVKKVVFMGMGEPAHNLEQVMEAITLMGEEGGIGHKNLVLSTVGDERVFARLAALQKGMVRPALAISLHATDAALRRKLLPHAPGIDPEVLMDRAECYARSVGYPIQYQWTLIEGINDTEEEMFNLIRLFKGKYAMMNFIAYNLTANNELKRPADEKMMALVSRLRAHGIVTCLRNSAGQDIEGACGQLRARYGKVP